MIPIEQSALDLREKMYKSILHSDHIIGRDTVDQVGECWDSGKKMISPTPATTIIPSNNHTQ